MHDCRCEIKLNPLLQLQTYGFGGDLGDPALPDSVGEEDGITVPRLLIGKQMHLPCSLLQAGEEEHPVTSLG